MLAQDHEQSRVSGDGEVEPTVRFALRALRDPSPLRGSDALTPSTSATTTRRPATRSRYGGWVCQDTEVPIHKVEHPPVLEDPHLDICGSRGCGEVVNCGFLQLSTCPQPRLTSVRRHSHSQDCRQPDHWQGRNRRQQVSDSSKTGAAGGGRRSAGIRPSRGELLSG